MDNKLITLSFHLWDWKIAVLLLALSVLALFFGSLPDNPPRPAGDVMRWVFWPITLLYLVGAALHGIGLF